MLTLKIRQHHLHPCRLLFSEVCVCWDDLMISIDIYLSLLFGLSTFER